MIAAPPPVHRQSVFTTFGAEADRLAGMTGWMTLAAAVIALAVAALMIHAMRAREGALDHRQGMRLVLIAGAIVPTVLLMTLLIVTLPSMRPMQPSPGGLVIDATGEQFWWRVQYRPAGAPPVTAANEVRVPVGEAVTIRLGAADVIHSFWIPGLAGKMDMVPGRTNTLVVRATRAGRFRGQCAEFCGLSHALMAFDVVAMERGQFDRWLAAQARPASADAPGRRLFAAYGCNGCHAIRGTEAAGAIGPDLTHLAQRRQLGAGLLPMNHGSLVRFVSQAPAVKPGVRMPAYPQMRATEAAAIARYLEMLK